MFIIHRLKFKIMKRTKCTSFEERGTFLESLLKRSTFFFTFVIARETRASAFEVSSERQASSTDDVLKGKMEN